MIRCSRSQCNPYSLKAVCKLRLQCVWRQHAITACNSFLRPRSLSSKMRSVLTWPLSGKRRELINVIITIKIKMPKNAYFLYMVDFRKDEEAKLGRNLSMESTIQIENWREGKNESNFFHFFQAEVSELAAASWKVCLCLCTVCITLWQFAVLTTCSFFREQEMGDERQALYRARAKWGNSVRNQRGAGEQTERKTAQGVAISEVDRVINEKLNEEKQMINRINNLLNHFTVPAGEFPLFFLLI